MRWARLWENVAEMVALAGSAEVFDNCGPGPATVATFVAGDIVGARRWPGWMPDALTRRWPRAPRKTSGSLPDLSASPIDTSSAGPE